MASRVLPSLLVALGCCAGAALARADTAGVTAALSPPLRAALVAEMQHLDGGLQRAVSALARADWPALERTAREIRGSFILEQRLAPEQRAELHRALPAPFLALDRRFHAQAERLADAAAAGDPELAAFRVHQLVESCLGCHAQYAPTRFPGLAPAAGDHRH